MSYFRTGNVAVRTREATALADVPTAFEVVDLAGRERIGPVGRQHFQIDDIDTVSSDAERADAAILGKLAGSERYLAGHAGGNRVQPANRGVELRLGGDYRPGHLA